MCFAKFGVNINSTQSPTEEKKKKAARTGQNAQSKRTLILTSKLTVQQSASPPLSGLKMKDNSN